MKIKLNRVLGFGSSGRGWDDLGQITRLLRDWQHDEAAHGQLVELVYGQLRRQASAYLGRERRNHTLKTEDLVHETYLRLAAQRRVRWRNHAHFFGISAAMMRRVLVNYAQARRCQKRGGGAETLRLDDFSPPAAERSAECLEVDAALAALARVDPHQAAAVELRYFGGFSRDEIAGALGVSQSTVARRLRVARAWLCRYLSLDARDSACDA